MELARVVLSTPLGDMIALDSGAGLAALEFCEPAARPARLEARLGRFFPGAATVERETPLLARVRAWLDAYFAGTIAEPFDGPLDLRGRPFERQVWEALRAIPAGETRSYGEVAAAIGRPAASRAVGAANGANPAALIVPCHRVIGSTGSLTGYGGGLDRKRWLLGHERRWRRAAALPLADHARASAP